MGTAFDGIDDTLAAWLRSQPVFLATAPLAGSSLDGLPGLPA